MADPKIEPAAEFQKLPLEMVVGTPLVAVAKAQAMAAQSTLDFILGLCGPPNGTEGPREPKTVALSIERQSAAANNPSQVTIKAPLLSIVPIPHLLIDSFTLNFKYEVSQTFRDKSETSESADLKVEAGTLVSPWVKASFHGNLTHSSSSESTTNRGGTLEIMVRASQSPIPLGLDRLLTMLAQSIPTT